MAEPAVLEAPKTDVVVTPVNPFAQDAWKTAPTIVEEAPKSDPVIDEKDQKIKEEKPISDKSNEPEKIPGATPLPIQEKPKEEEKKPEAVKPTAAETKFANEESEKLFNLIKEGKTEDVYKILHEQQTLASVDKMNPADAIKLNLQYQNKDFSSDDINDLFNERYAFPEKPVELATDTEEEYKEKLAKYDAEVKKVENRIARDAKPAKTELLKLQKEIVLPDIPRSEAPKSQPTQEELDADKIWNENFLKTVDEGVQKFNGYNATFKDEEVELQVAYVPTDEDRKAIQPLLALSGTDAGAFLQKIGWVDDKGNINIQKLTEDLPFIINKKSVLDKMVSETGNKRHEASIKGIKNINYSGKDKSNGDLSVTPEQLQKNMATHFFAQ